MLINDNGNLYINNVNNRNNSCGTKLFKLPIKKLNIQSRNTNNNYSISSKNSTIKNKNSLYSTKEATPRKEHNQVLTHTSIKKSYYSSKEKLEKNDLDDSLSQISQLLNSNKKDLNYSGLIGKFPGINEEPNFIYDQIIFNKSSINKAKILSHKIGVLKLPISNISSKEALTNSDNREKKCFSDRAQGNGKYEGNKNISNSKMDDAVGFSCCFFGRK
jgi:hypothetical protein